MNKNVERLQIHSRRIDVCLDLESIPEYVDHALGRSGREFVELLVHDKYGNRILITGVPGYRFEDGNGGCFTTPEVEDIIYKMIDSSVLFEN